MSTGQPGTVEELGHQRGEIQLQGKLSRAEAPFS